VAIGIILSFKFNIGLDQSLEQDVHYLQGAQVAG
jgi:hypothetical protein